ncbi:MAG: peptidylprolyl isomerase, partial [Pseudolabrys sp.]
RTWQRPPSAEELRGLVDDYIRDEVFYREGKALGLDRDDIVIRRRLRQKMEFVAEDMGVAEPSDDQLRAYLTSNAERFKSEDRVTFSHIYLSASRGDALKSDAPAIAAKLASITTAPDASELGDRFLLGEEFRTLPRSEAAHTFGDRFADQLFNLDQGRWQGPIASNYGLHFVRVSERERGGLLPLDDVRSTVRREWMYARRLEAEGSLYRTLRERYQIVVEAPPAEGPPSKKISADSQ